jgi:hypothetical protein
MEDVRFQRIPEGIDMSSIPDKARISAEVGGSELGLVGLSKERESYCLG